MSRPLHDYLPAFYTKTFDAALLNPAGVDHIFRAEEMPNS
jgi:hypothetical protein